MSGYVDSPGAADYLGVKVQTLATWRYQKRGPRYSKVGRMIRYRVSDLDAYMQRHASEPRYDFAPPKRRVRRSA
jgi:predicted DNA-binding transcriptional regulator AlpA